MSGLRLLAIAGVLVVGLGTVLVASAAGAGVGVGVESSVDGDAEINESDNGTDGSSEDHPSDTDSDEYEMGPAVSSFMQSSSADTEASVDAGMFDAAYEQREGAQREAIIANRSTDLESDLEALETEREALAENESELNPAAYDARMSQLAVRIDALEQAANTTESRANRHGLETQPFEGLRQGAHELRGPAVAASMPNGGLPPHSNAIGDQPRGAADGAGGPNANASESGSGSEIGNGTGSENAQTETETATDTASDQNRTQESDTNQREDDGTDSTSSSSDSSTGEDTAGAGADADAGGGPTETASDSDRSPAAASDDRPERDDTTGPR